MDETVQESLVLNQFLLCVLLGMLLCVLSVCVSAHRHLDDLDEGVLLGSLLSLQLQLRVQGHQVVLLRLQSSHLGAQGVGLRALIGPHRDTRQQHDSRYSLTAASGGRQPAEG